ncbi:MAG: TonB-dependent receptor [Prevotella sp.]|nr:TonB-dependent receptor [Prevotella sp.]
MLNNIIITGEKNDFLSLQKSGTKLDMKMMDMMPNILGNADPLHYLQFLPGIQMNNEYDAGLYINGCDNGHNMVSVEGVPIYNPGHLLGIFSTFNAAHYKSILIDTHPDTSESPNRVGGNADMKLYDNLPQKTNGQVSIGPISSQGTVKIPLFTNAALFFSGRLSYLNLLYSQWLDIDGSKIKYNFGDFNVTYLQKINKKNTLWIDGYYGLDNAEVDDKFYGIDLSLKWGNKMLAAHLKTEIADFVQLKQKLYLTNYENRLTIKSDYVGIGIPSGISTYGYSANVDYKRLKIGMDASLHSIELQSPAISSYYQESSIKTQQHSQEVSTYIEYDLPWRSVLFRLGVRGSLFHENKDKTYFSADPSVSIIYESTNNWDVKLTGYQRHQFLSQTGVSSIGLPIEFWMSSTEPCPPQKVQGITLRWQKFFNSQYLLSIEGFYKKLYHQIEYVGDLLDLKERSYNLYDNLVPSKGYNYGLSFIVTKRTGKIVGWMSYTYTKTRRSAESDMLGQDYPSSHERPHELDMVVTYKQNKRWDFGSTFVFASGTPFTAPSAFYYSNGNIISIFDEYNRNRLPGYLRLDLSANYYLKNEERVKSGINISLYNTLNCGNPLLYRLKLYDNEYGYKRLTFVMNIMPSISFFYKF